MLLPMLRNKWKIAMPSGRNCLSRVANVTIVIGTHNRPTPNPCSALAHATAVVETSRLNCGHLKTSQSLQRKSNHEPNSRVKAIRKKNDQKAKQRATGARP